MGGGGGYLRRRGFSDFASGSKFWLMKAKQTVNRVDSISSRGTAIRIGVREVAIEVTVCGEIKRWVFLGILGARRRG